MIFSTYGRDLKILEDSLNLQQSYYEKELTKLYNDAKNALKDVQSKANRLFNLKQIG